MKKYRLPVISLFIIALSIAYIEMFVEDNIFIVPLSKPWEFAVPNQEVPKGLASLSAQHCGTCHVKHYEEWQKSTHAQAWTDMQFQAELLKETSPFMCINCHIPLQNQQEHLIKGLQDGDLYKPVKVPNPHFDKSLQMEGITCAGCHVRNNQIVGPTGSTTAPHPVVKDNFHLSENLCISCHNANAVVTPTLACTFETGDEWKSGPFHGKKNCISCHMPETHREIVPGYAPRKSRFHAFPASGIPKSPDHKPERLESLEFVSTPLKDRYKAGDSIHYNLTLSNTQAGHRVPTGNPERFIMIDYQIKNQDGKIIKEASGRIGEEWEWHPVAKKLGDNNLNPGESRSFPLNIKIDQSGKYTLYVKVSKHRLTPESAQYNKLGKDYPLFIDVYNQNLTFTVL